MPTITPCQPHILIHPQHRPTTYPLKGCFGVTAYRNSWSRIPNIHRRLFRQHYLGTSEDCWFTLLSRGSHLLLFLFTYQTLFEISCLIVIHPQQERESYPATAEHFSYGVRLSESCFYQQRGVYQSPGYS